jgi:hypothetical protein
LLECAILAGGRTVTKQLGKTLTKICEKNCSFEAFFDQYLQFKKIDEAGVT